MKPQPDHIVRAFVSEISRIFAEQGTGRMIRAIELPGVAELNRNFCGQGGWFTNEELQQRADSVCASLFGVTPADCAPPEPEMWDFLPESERAKSCPRALDDDEDAAFSQAWDSWDEIEGHFDRLDPEEVADEDALKMFAAEGVDLLDDDDVPLRCWRAISRPLLAARLGLFGAKLSADGSGKRKPPPASVEAWGASMARAAREWKGKSPESKAA